MLRIFLERSMRFFLQDRSAVPACREIRLPRIVQTNAVSSLSNDLRSARTHDGHDRTPAAIRNPENLRRHGAMRIPIGPAPRSGLAKCLVC